MRGGPLSVFDGARVVLTGDTGFKGAWLATWLTMLGADVHGIGLAPPLRGAFRELDVASEIAHHDIDIRDYDAVADAVRAARPDLVFHLAAQPIVSVGWADRRTTYETNVLGTVNVVEAALATETARAVVVATTDKVYENTGTGERFREGDRLGGHDPYSASKAAAELALVPYRSAQHMGFAATPVVSVRAGNVIGGGDWSPDRLVPDIVRALQRNDKVVLRHPHATRPWQHVLDCLWGYLLVARRALTTAPVSPAYNFARPDGARQVIDVARSLVRLWGAADDTIVVEPGPPGREATLLELDATHASHELGWAPAWSFEDTLTRTLEFYRADDKASVGRAQIEAYHEVGAGRAAEVIG